MHNYVNFNINKKIDIFNPNVSKYNLYKWEFEI